MKKNMFAAQALCAALSAMMLLAGCGGSGSAAPATTAAAGTQAAEAAAAETTTAPVFEVTLNYDLVDLIGNDADSVKKALGEAEADETAEAFRKMTFKGGKQIVMLYTDSEELNYGREGLVWLIEADASDIISAMRRRRFPHRRSLITTSRQTATSCTLNMTDTECMPSRTGTEISGRIPG